MIEFYEERISRKPENLADLPIVPQEKLVVSDKTVDSRLTAKHIHALEIMLGN